MHFLRCCARARPAPRIARRHAQREQGIFNAAATGGSRHFFRARPCIFCPLLARVYKLLQLGKPVPRVAWICSLLFASACTGDETLSAYGAAGKVWHLSSIDNAAYPAFAWLTFPEPGKVAGRAPCNSFQGTQTAPYPWFSAETLTTARAACPELTLEADFLQSLQKMTLAEVSGDVLILSNGQGREMLFTAGG
ncbi:META domain-containing protein [Leisingera sp. M523]|nr:META domain-containing protein [Leisingera sp. M523]